MNKIVLMIPLLLITFMSTQTSAEFSPSCPKLSQPNNCDFYEKCLEEKNQCGIDGYPLNYGLKFCNVFNSMELSSSGEKWITATMACLQEGLVDFAEKKTSCSVIEAEAFGSHVQCYVDSGFCDLPFSDKTKIATTNFWATVTSLAGTVQAAKTLVECFK